MPVARFGEIGAAVQSVELIEANGTLRTVDCAALDFGYRHSAVGDRIVTRVTFDLKAVDDQPALRHRLKDVMKYKKDSQPMAADSAGCAFKNPRSQSDKGAGRLIDEAGLKGFRIGGAEISTIHANFIVAHEGATARDLLAVMNHAQQTVQQKFGITIEREVVVWE